MPMLFNVSQLLKSDVGDSRTYEISWDDPLDLGDAVATDIEGTIRFVLINFGIIAQVEATGTLHLTCARCLEPFELRSTVTFDEEYQPVIDVHSGLPTTMRRDEGSSAISANHSIDMGDALRENFVVSMDLRPLCRASCQGLCPHCGINRNDEFCTCGSDEETSPLAELVTLLRDQTGNQQI
jgi:uncharacterized protein